MNMTHCVRFCDDFASLGASKYKQVAYNDVNMEDTLFLSLMSCFGCWTSSYFEICNAFSLY
mgnify:CR=1 FL=1